jgi:hypothetical protein
MSADAIPKPRTSTERDHGLRPEPRDWTACPADKPTCLHPDIPATRYESAGCASTECRPVRDPVHDGPAPRLELVRQPLEAPGAEPDPDARQEVIGTPAG